MGGIEGGLPVVVLGDDLRPEAAGVPDGAGTGDEVTVHEPAASSLEDRIVDPQHLPAHQLIIPIHHQKYLPVPTALPCRPPKTPHRPLPLLIPLHPDPAPHPHLPHILLQQSPSAIRTAIINHHHMIVPILLLQDGVQVVFVSVRGLVVVGGYYDAEGELLWVVVGGVVLLVVELLAEGDGGGGEWGGF